MSAENRAVFLSYASQDAAAVLRIAEALRAAGVEVWFDQDELVGGDAWDAKIRGQIAACALFVPVISAATQARLEGYFRIEWKLAARRTHAMATARAFLLPIVIDDTRDADAHVPDEFRDVQWTRLSAGEANATFCLRVRTLLAAPHTSASAATRARQSTGATGVDLVALPRRRGYGWLAAGGCVLAAVGLAIWQPWRSQRDRTPNPAALPSPGSPTDGLVANIRAIVEKDADATRDDWLLAENLGAEAVRQEPGNGRAWAAYAEGTLGLYVFYFDRTRDALADTLKHAQKAVSLAPDRDEGHVVLAAAYAVRRETRAEAEQMLRKLVARAPQDARRLRLLAATLRMKAASAQTPEDSPDYREIFALYDLAARDAVHAPLALREKAALLAVFGQVNEAETTLARSLALRPSPAATAQKVSTLLRFGRLDEADAALDAMPGSYLLREDICELAAKTWLWKRDAARCLRVLNGWPEDFLAAIPKGLMIGQAQQLLNRPEAARLAWQAALAKVEQEAAETAGTPQVQPYLYFRALLLVCLGDAKRSEEARQMAEQAGRLNATQRATLLVLSGKPTEAVDAVWQVRDTYRRVTGDGINMSRVALGRSELRFDPTWDPIRADPRFQAVVDAWDRHVTNQPAESNRTAALPAASDKSLVVLPLENLSPDPEDAFFTGGMHFEIIQTLSRIPDLKVISRDSALALRESNLSLAEKARKVGVTNVVTGSVRRAGARVLIALELRRARDEALLWTKTYERDAIGAYAIQGEVAAEMARVLQARDQRGSFAGARFQTQNAQAYRLFQKLRDAHLYENSLTSAERIAQAEKIVQLDAEFMPAVTLLSMAHAARASGTREAAERKTHADLARQWAEKAAALVPGGAGDGALANYYSVTRDYEQALLYAENTARASPNDATSHAFVASALEGLGRNAEALAAYERALALDPMNVGLHSNRLELLVALRRPDGFEAACAKWREVQPEVSATLFFPGRFRLYGEIPKELVGLRVYDTALWLWRTRRFADLISLLDAELARGDMAVRMRFDVLEKKAQALRRTDRFNDLQTVAQEMSGIAGQLLDDDDAEYAHDSSRVAKAKALNGEVDAAVSTLRRAIATTSAAKQMWRARVQRTHLAEILAAAGRAKECVALLAEILAAGSPTLSVLSLRLDPTWDSVREDAAFKALLADPKNSAPL